MIILHFRHLLERNGLGSVLFEDINRHLASRGHQMKTGMIVDASIIVAPSSTKKGNQWHFGMKAHIGVDAEADWRVAIKRGKRLLVVPRQLADELVPSAYPESTGREHSAWPRYGARPPVA